MRLFMVVPMTISAAVADFGGRSFAVSTDLCRWKNFFGGVVDTGEQFIGGVVDTAEQLFASVDDTGE